MMGALALAAAFIAGAIVIAGCFVYFGLGNVADTIASLVERLVDSADDSDPPDDDDDGEPVPEDAPALKLVGRP